MATFLTPASRELVTGKVRENYYIIVDDFMGASIRIFTSMHWYPEVKFCWAPYGVGGSGPRNPKP